MTTGGSNSDAEVPLSAESKNVAGKDKKSGVEKENKKITKYGKEKRKKKVIETGSK